MVHGPAHIISKLDCRALENPAVPGKTKGALRPGKFSRTAVLKGGQDNLLEFIDQFLGVTIDHLLLFRRDVLRKNIWRPGGGAWA